MNFNDTFMWELTNDRDNGELEVVCQVAKKAVARFVFLLQNVTDVKGNHPLRFESM